MPTPVDKEQQQATSLSGDGANGAGGDGAGQESTETPSRARRILRYVLYAVGGLIGLVLLFLVVVVLLLQTGWGAQKAVDTAIDLANPYEDATITVGDVDGSFLSSLALYDVNLTREDGVRMAHLDTVRLRYSLLPLLSSRLEVSDVLVAGPDISIHQRPDSTWDLLAPFGDTTAVEDTSSSSFAVQVDEITLRRATLSADFYAGERDSTLQIEGLNARVTDLLLGDALAVNLDTLYGQYEQTGIPGPVALGVGAQLQDNRFTLSGLRLDSPNSDVKGQGTLRLPESEDDTIDDIDFTLQAQPLSFQDLRPFAPSLAPEGRLTLDVRAQGSGRLVDANIDGRFFDGDRAGGTLALSAEATPTTEGPLQYQVEGQVRDLDLELFTSGGVPTDSAALAGTVNADLDVDLEGETLESLSGTADATVFETQFGEFALDRTTLTTEFTDGQAELDLATGLRGLAVTAAGTLRPFDEAPSYDLAGRLDNLDIGRVTGDTTQSSDLSLAFSVEGQGIDPETLDATAAVTLAPSTLNGYALEGGEVDVRLGGGDVGFDLRMNVQEGLLAASGAVGLGDEMTYAIREGRFENINVAALTGDTTASSLSGTFSLEGRGTDPETLSLQAALGLDATSYGLYTINDAGLEATLRGGRLQSNLNADLQGGTFNLAATARPFAEPLTFEVTEGRFQNVDIGELTGNPAQSSDLNGTLSVSGRGSDPEAMRLDARLDLRDSQLNQQGIESAALVAALRQGNLDYDLTLDLPEGTTTLAGSAQPFGEEPVYTVREGSFNGLDVGALAGNPTLQTDLNGTLSVDGRGADPATMNLQARLGLDRSQVNEAVITDGATDVSLQDGLADLSSSINLEEGRIQLDATGRFMDETPTYTAQGRVENLNIAAFIGATDSLEATASLGFDLEGEGTDMGSMDVQGQITSDGIRYDSVRVEEINARFLLRDGVAQVDTLLLRSNIAEATGGGQIAVTDSLAASDFSLTVDLTSLAPVKPILDADVLSLTDSQIQARVYGRPGRLRFETTADINSFIFNSIRLAGLDGRVAGELNPDRSLRAVETDMELGYLSAGDFDIENTSFKASYADADQEVDFETNLTLDENRDVQFGGTVDLRPESQRVVLDAFGLRSGETRWQLLQDASISYGDTYRIRNFLVYADGQQIAIDGVVDPDGEQNLVLTIEDFVLDSFTDLFGFDALGGTLNGSIDLTGPATDPNLDGALRVDIQSFGRPAGDLNLEIDYDSLRMRLDTRLTNTDGSSLQARGTLPLDLRLSVPDSLSDPVAAGNTVLATSEVDPSSEVDFTVQADSFSLGWARPFLDPATVDELTGALVADLHIGGTLDGPLLDGTARLVGGRVGLPDLGVTYRQISADVGLQDNQVLLNSLSVSSGEGKLTGEGRIDFGELTLGEFNIEIGLDEFLGIDSREFRAVVGGSLDISGTTDAPVLGGNLTILSADINLVNEAGGAASGIEDVTLSPEEMQEVEENFGVNVSAADTTTSDAFLALKMDLDVGMERDLWIRSASNPELQIQFTGSLELQKEPGQELPQLFGDIEVLDERSYVRQFGKRFTIDNGVIRFNGDILAPVLDIDAAYEVPSQNNREGEVTITLAIEGNFAQMGTDEEDRLELTLGSDPQMSESDIACYLALGRPCGAGSTGGGEGESLGGRAAGLALGQVAGLVEGLAGSELGLDVIEIEQDGLRGATLTAGKYLSRRLYAAVRQPISFSGGGGASTGSGENAATELVLEYEVFQWLLVRLTRDGSALRSNLLWEYAY